MILEVSELMHLLLLLLLLPIRALALWIRKVEHWLESTHPLLTLDVSVLRHHVERDVIISVSQERRGCVIVKTSSLF